MRVEYENRARKPNRKRGRRKTKIEREKGRELGGDFWFRTGGRGRGGLLAGRKTKKMRIFQGVFGKDFGELE